MVGLVDRFLLVVGVVGMCGGFSGEGFSGLCYIYVGNSMMLCGLMKLVISKSGCIVVVLLVCCWV